MKRNIIIMVCFFIIIGLFLLPLGIELLIRYGIFGYSFPETIFTNDQWFAFWGSYLGAIITVIVLFVTIQYNRLENRRTFEDYRIEQKYDGLLKNIKEIHMYVNLCDFYGKELDKDSLLYTIKLSDKRYFELMNNCEQLLLGINSEYIPFVKQMFYEYLLEIDKVPKSLNEIDIQDAAEIYKASRKKIYSIKHSYVQKENSMYDDVVNLIELKKVEEKAKNFSIFDKK